MSVFYNKFERHAHGEGLKGQSTHYCAGCGHGLVHKLLSQAIEELGIQDNTVIVSPVGCSVFAYYYFDTGNTQAAHGRAPAVAIGHKMANPEAPVISYQGDGDLASIGLAETVATAQLGAPVTVIFINNAIYGMTGGQMAPTTLIGQKATTCPAGRSEEWSGLPIKMCEMLSAVPSSYYIERVAVNNTANIAKAKKAIAKAFRLQMEGKGFTMIEVLSTCHTNWGLSPVEALDWLEKNMIPYYPLGVYKDKEAE